MRNEFGPNQERVDALLVRLENVDQVQAMFLAGLTANDRERRRAREAMLAAARRSGREKELHRAQDEVRRWVNGWFSGGPQLSGYGRDVTPGEAAVNAAPLVLDAIGATVVGDLLTAEDVDTLTAPWRALWEEPETA